MTSLLPLCCCFALWTLLSATAVSNLNRHGELKSYCQWQQMDAKCEGDEVIVFEEALYGRMEYGPCIASDYGYIGCRTDVRMLADKRCSGRRSCTIKVPDELFDGISSCPDDLKKYLAVRYSCVKVVTPLVRKCIHPDTSPLTAQEGFISSYVTNKTGCGSANAPWRINLGAGQRIKFSLIDFAVSPNDSKADRSYCSVYAIIKDPHSEVTKSETVCGMSPTASRERHIMTTEGNQAEIRIMSSASFLLKYEAVGCPNLSPSNGGWFRRDDRKPEQAEAGCERDGTKWTLTCNGRIWEGRSENCSTPTIQAGTYGNPGQSFIPKSSAFLIVIGIAVVIGFCILAIGVLIIKRQRYGPTNRRTVPPQCPLNKLPAEGKVPHQIVRDPRETPYTVHPPLLVNDSPYSDENEYAYVEEYQSISPKNSGKPNTFASGPCPQQHVGISPPAQPHTGPGNLDMYGPPVGQMMNADLYNSLDDSVYRSMPGQMPTSPGNSGRGLHPYHVLDFKDNQPKKDSTDMV